MGMGAMGSANSYDNRLVVVIARPFSILDGCVVSLLASYSARTPFACLPPSICPMPNYPNIKDVPFLHGYNVCVEVFVVIY